jgi:hypothetical protein
MKNSLFGLAFGMLVCLAALTPTSAYAYLDPGTGTFALQGLIAGVTGCMIAVRAYWGRIGRLFRRSKPSSEIWCERSLPDGDA